MQDLVLKLRELSEEWLRLTEDGSAQRETERPDIAPVRYEEYMVPIPIASLVGEAAPSDVPEQVRKMLGPRFSTADLGRLKSGGKVWALGADAHERS
jgi:hypothetical protein